VLTVIGESFMEYQSADAVIDDVEVIWAMLDHLMLL
jgi:hypothetical protein